jgi:hypothetical protein
MDLKSSNSTLPQVIVPQPNTHFCHKLINAIFINAWKPFHVYFGFQTIYFKILRTDIEHNFWSILKGSDDGVLHLKE